MQLLDNRIISFYTTSSDGNMAYYTTDSKDEVTKNREQIALKYGFDIGQLRYMNQVHGNNIQIVDSESPSLIMECDGIITNKKNLPLMVQIADCIGILFYDTKKQVIAAAHAGRNGTFLNISSKILNKMRESFDSNPEDIKVTLSPSIQKCCYEVDIDMANLVKNNFGEEFVDNRHIDLQGINKIQLLQNGVKDKNIYISYTCTKCSQEPYFSYRNNPNCGRFSGVIMLKDYK